MEHHKKHHSAHKSPHRNQHHMTHHTHHHEGLKRHIMENRNLVIGIVVIFALIIILGGVFFFGGFAEDEESEVTEQVSSLVQTCERWCDEEKINFFCDSQLSASETVKGTCNGLSKSTIYAEYGVQGCPSIDCENRPEVTEMCVEDLGGVWEAPAATGECTQEGDSQRVVLVPTDSSPTSGQICCSPVEFFE
ncbi:MAG: hypothetical protein Q8P81_01200 [Nanoarchaeota archaeon]|nr:hypothetical protein [Nanoarchaeota archaeon]